MLWAQWWVWAVAGLVLGLLEVALPGQILLGFGIGALATAAVVFVAGVCSTRTKSVVSGAVGASACI